MSNCKDYLGPVMQTLLAAAEQALDDCDRPVPLVFVEPGTSVSWDNCCECGGQLWVRVIDVTPQPASAQVCDITSLQVRLGVGVLRCVHTVTDERFPTGAEMTSDAMVMAADSHTLLHAIRCADLGNTVYPKTLHIDRGTALGLQGGCGGWEWTLSFKLAVCLDC